MVMQKSSHETNSTNTRLKKLGIQLEKNSTRILFTYPTLTPNPTNALMLTVMLTQISSAVLFIWPKVDCKLNSTYLMNKPSQQDSDNH